MMTTLFPSLLPKFHPSLNVSLVGIGTMNSQTKITIHNCQSKIIHKKKISTTTQGIRSKHHSSHERIFKILDDFICKFIIFNTSLPRHVDPKHELSGNFYPVEELPPTACEVVEGSLPPTLEGGAYIQNGPNPQFIPRGPYYIADGDGMLHSIKFSGGGKAIFCSRFVKTHKYVMERDLGYPFFPNPVAYFISNSARFILLTVARVISGGKINPFTTGIGTANTSLFLFVGHLFAMIESDLPYAIKISPDGDIITIGRHDFHSSSDNDLFLNMTAHPKFDADTGEAFAFRYNVIIPPFLTFFRIDPNGRKQKDVPIFSIKGVTSYMHDFAVTKRFAVFLDAQLVIDPLGILRGKKILRFDHQKTPRLGVIPRYATDESEMYWTDVPGLNMMHVINAWEEDDAACNKIVMVVTNILPVENLLERRNSTRLSLEKITIDTKTKEVVRCIVSTRNIDFGAINPKYAGKKNRYMYAAAIENYPKMIGVVKLDLSLCEEYSCDSAVVATRIYGPGCYGSEPIFVAREANNPTAEEDDGYLLVYVHDENNKESKFIVMNAKSPSLEVIAAVKLPGRVPHGFHTTFVSQVDLLKP